MRATESSRLSFIYLFCFCLSVGLFVSLSICSSTCSFVCLFLYLFVGYVVTFDLITHFSSFQSIALRNGGIATAEEEPCFETDPSLCNQYDTLEVTMGRYFYDLTFFVIVITILVRNSCYRTSFVAFADYFFSRFSPLFSLFTSRFLPGRIAERDIR